MYVAYIYYTNTSDIYVSIKAVGSGKAGKALALPDFPPSEKKLY